METENKRPRAWSAKGRCPHCSVATGSRHNPHCLSAFRAKLTGGKKADKEKRTLWYRIASEYETTGVSMAELGRKYGYTRERIRQIIKKYK